MTSASDRYRRRAEGHRARAVSYRDDANLLLTQYGKPDSAGALIYESAKQCINAIANWNGQNPGATGGKTRHLETIAAQPPGDSFDLVAGCGGRLLCCTLMLTEATLPKHGFRKLGFSRRSSSTICCQSTPAASDAGRSLGGVTRRG